MVIEMKGTAMSLRAAASGFIFFLLSVPVVQGANEWAVTCTSTQICAAKGSTMEISCTFKYPSIYLNVIITVQETFWLIKTDAPKVPSVSVRPSGEILEGSSVNLTCTHDAYIKVNYTWYKESQAMPSKEPQLVFSSIQTSDSAEYYLSPSDKIEEGSSVNLTCSSDANPAANYSWYKGNQTLFQGTEGIYNFTSISSEDRGIYYCKSENQYGVNTSSNIFLDVQYGPKLPSVSVSPSEIEEGSSVTLTCSSDANPAANYTWYKEDEDSPKASGQIFTITDFRAEHSGSFFGSLSLSDVTI
ncbi:B-cell receptor CD22-like [Notothenia coriiceps]|uniref:B-cell receptor CD22-like n=1 Tax=Notothenia coriiceps TaxID=8208 RepID=A0A6I9NKQ1_9TELE|nr:PREDICTED: B-cell receptor CD22-like [Notothenia coriiceps]